MNKVEILQQYRDCIDLWTGFVDEERRLRSLAESITASLSGLPGGTGDKPGKVGIVIEGLEHILEGISDSECHIEQLRNNALQVIESVSDYRERKVLRLRYINGQTWREISAQTGYDERYIRRLHRRALEHLKAGV